MSDTTRKARRYALRQLARAQRERSALTRLGLRPAADRAHKRAQGWRAVVRDLTVGGVQ